MGSPVTTPASRAARERACLDVVRRLAALMRGGGSPWLELELPMGQFKAMMALSALGPLSVGRLARRLGIAEPSASLLVDKLQTQGLVVRSTDAADRRRTLVELTDEARALVARLQEVRDERLAELLAGLDDDDLQALHQGMQALVRAASDETHELAQESPICGRRATGAETTSDVRAAPAEEVGA
jgi:DNA-binding MarR family transcriptional regulator